MVNRSWLPSRELDHTICPCALPPTSRMACLSASAGCSSLPLGGPPPMVAHDTAPIAAATAAARIAQEKRCRREN
jgi:hypothetical protein